MTVGSPGPTPGRRLREVLAATVPPRLQIIRSDGTYTVSLEGRPFLAEGLTLETAVTELITVLREFADYTGEHPEAVHDLDGSRDLAQLVRLSTDEELVTWLWRRT